MMKSLVEYLQIAHVIQIHLPMMTMQGLKGRTLLSQSHPERLLLHYLHPLTDPFVVMILYPRL